MQDGNKPLIKILASNQHLQMYLDEGHQPINGAQWCFLDGFLFCREQTCRKPLPSPWENLPLDNSIFFLVSQKSSVKLVESAKCYVGQFNLWILSQTPCSQMLLSLEKLCDCADRLAAASLNRCPHFGKWSIILVYMKKNNQLANC